MGLNNADVDEAIGILDPVNISRTKALLGENGSAHAIDMQIAHGLISLESKPKKLSWDANLLYNNLN